MRPRTLRGDLAGLGRRADPITLILAIAGLALVLTGLVVVGPASAQAVTPIELNSTWTDALALFESQWIDQFGESSQPVSVSNVLATGDQFAKRNLLEGDGGGKKIGLDFIVSGTRLTAAELATAKAGYTQIPVAVSSLAVTLRAPSGAGAQGWRTREPGVTVDPVTEEEISKPIEPYKGPLKLNSNLLFQLYTGEGFELAKTASFAQDNAANFLANGGVFSTAIGRVDPGAIPKQMRAYFGARTPVDLAKVYTALQIDPAGLRPEEWPFLSKPTRSNNTTLLNALVQSSTPDGAPAGGGMVGVLDNVNAVAAIARYPTVDLRVAELQNGAGKFVAPTKAAVLAGINSGLGVGSPATTFVENAGLNTTTATNAYPLTWLEWLIVPSSGLSADKANAIATIARFIALPGQGDLDKAGTPALSSSLVASALAAADDLVRSNCTMAGYRAVTRGDAGPHAPTALALPANTTIAWCEKVPVTPSTTTTTTTTKPTASTSTSTSTSTTSTSTSVPNPIVEDEVPVSVLPATISRTSGTAPPASTPIAAAPPPTTMTAAPPSTSPAAEPAAPNGARVQLPEEPPKVPRSQFDRVTTMGMGGCCLLGAARRYRRKFPT